MGRRIDEFSARSRFSPCRTQRPLLILVGIHHVLAPVVKVLSTPWYRLHLVIDVTLSGNHASTGMLAEQDSEHDCRLFSGRSLRPLSVLRETTFISGGDRLHAMLFGTAIEFMPISRTSMFSLAVSSKCDQHQPSTRERSYRCQRASARFTSCVPTPTCDF